MRVHFIAIGGSAMHSLAIALQRKGYEISGSDDEIFEPSRGRLKAACLLPSSEGWDPSRITADLDAVILGMHAKADNPELLRAKETGVRIYSYPEYLYEQSKNKKRVVIGGSHGKTTITAMVLHVLRAAGIDSDYMIGARLKELNDTVKLSEEAGIMIFEGDEYLTSPIDPRPKFHLYRPDIALLSGIAWDHINVFRTFEIYVDQFRQFIPLISPGGVLIWCADDEVLRKICPVSRKDLSLIPYSLPEYKNDQGRCEILLEGKVYPLAVFGRHNLLNLSGAMEVCRQLGISREVFLSAIQTFSGASKRLEIIASSENCAVYKDFAHAPSKVRATISAVREQYPGRKIIACLELHTYSSLSKEFLGHYRGTMDSADIALVYFNPHAIQLKRLLPVTEDDIRAGFSNPGLQVFSDSNALTDFLNDSRCANSVLLLMSSGDFDGMNLQETGETFVQGT